MRAWPIVLLGVTCLVVVSCDEPATAPSGPLQLSVVAGDGQSGLPGAELRDPLVVRVEDSKGKRVVGQIVNFRVVSGGGSVFGGAALTGKDGIAKERWTLGTAGPQRVEARAVDVETGAPLTFAAFDATLLDAVAPTVTINQASAQTDPTNTGPISFSVVFSESVTGFSGSDVSLAGSTVDGSLSPSVTGSGASYTVSVAGMIGQGTVVASIPAGAAVDGAGTPSAGSTSTDNTVTFDAVAPTVTINQASGQADPASAGPLLFTVFFSEPVSGFTAAGVSFAGSTAGGTLVAAVSGSGANYTVSVTGMSSSGTVVASILAGVAFDATGNGSAGSTSTDDTITFSGTGTVANVPDYCVLEFPVNFTGAAGMPTSIFGRVSELGLTPAFGLSGLIRAALGYGPLGTDPRAAAGWSFFPADYNISLGDVDEYVATIPAPSGGSYSTVYRFSVDAGATWAYCDSDGSGSNAGLSFDLALLGVMVVTP